MLKEFNAYIARLTSAEDDLYICQKTLDKYMKNSHDTNVKYEICELQEQIKDLNAEIDYYYYMINYLSSGGVL